MADFFNKLKKSIDKGGAKLSAKSSTFIETNKLKSEITAVNRVKNDALMTLGRKVYDEGKEGTFSIESAEELITKISEQEAKVVDLEAKIALIQEEEKTKMDALNAEEPVEEVIVEASDVVEEVQGEVQEMVEDVVELVADDEPEQY